MDTSRIETILQEALSQIKECASLDAINEIRNRYLAKKSELMSLMSVLGSLSNEEFEEFFKSFL